MRTPVALSPSSYGKVGAMSGRRRFKQLASLEDRLTAFTQKALKEAEALPAGPERDEMLMKAKRAQGAKEMNAWVNSPGLQPPQ
jgi:hypothetical protein